MYLIMYIIVIYYNYKYKIIYTYLRLPMYAKLLPFQELLPAAFFSASEQILHVSHVAYVCRFWNGEKTQRNGEKTRRNGETNQEPKMWKLKRRKKLETANI